MLAVAVSGLRRSNKDDERAQQEEGEEETAMEKYYFSSSCIARHDDEDEDELSQGSLLESINFDDLFAGIDDVLPDLFSAADDDFSLTTQPHHDVNTKPPDNATADYGGSNNSSPSPSSSSSSDSDNSGANSGSSSHQVVDEVIVLSRRDDQSLLLLNPSPTNNNNNNTNTNHQETDDEKGRRKSSSSSSKNHPQPKKKVKKVDWTPELHRRFVQAVEQLGVDKAVPSRILEVMGIDCLTRHNIASHLQKYRSHRKHLLAREAEAASWSQRRQMMGGGKREAGSPWVAATIGFPPPMTLTPPMQMPMPPHFRPLHVWGHPTMDIIWPKPPPPWAPPPSPSPSPSQPPPNNSDPSFWHHHRAPNALTPGAPCFPQPPPLTTTRRFGCPTPTSSVAAAGIPPLPHAMYKVDPGIALPARQPPPPPLFDFHPSKESVDAAIGDVLSKPWLPLPLGLKAPAIESVMGELQRQGIPKVPPSCA